ncbi:hypothetical protein D3C76_1750490 [compost metagenome]
MNELLQSIKESRTIWAWTDDDVWFHITREGLDYTWGGSTDEEIAELVHKNFSVCVWAFNPEVKSRQWILEDACWGGFEDDEG